MDSTPSAVRDVLEVCDAAFGSVGMSMDARGNAQLVLAEALNNIVEHAYQEKAGGEIQLHMEYEPDGIGCSICDSGLPMPGLQLPLVELPDSSGPLDTLPEGGFGWFLIHQLTRNLCYDRVGGQNILSFSLRFT